VVGGVRLPPAADEQSLFCYLTLVVVCSTAFGIFESRMRLVSEQCVVAALCLFWKVHCAGSWAVMCLLGCCVLYGG
jgi:hypothetical protein